MSHSLLPGTLPDFSLDRALTLVQVAQRIRAPQGGRLNVAVVWRWATRGYTCRGWDGAPLVLPNIVIGKRRYTMPDWLKLFEAARVRMGEKVANARRPVKTQTPRQASADHKRAVNNLKAAGFTVGGKA